MAKASKLIPIIAGALIPAVAVVIFMFRGKICAMTWSGNDTLRCNSELTIKDKTVALDTHVIYAQSKCRLTLVNVTFEAPTPIYVNGGKVTIKNSRLKAQKHAIYLGTGSQVIIQKTTIESDGDAIYAGTGSRFTMTGGVLKAKKNAVYAGTDAMAVFKDTTIHGEIYTSKGAEVKGAVIAGLRERWYCRGKTEATLKDVNLKTRTNALTASDQCRLRLVNCQLESRTTPLRAQDKARVVVQGGGLKGRSAVWASGSAVVELKAVDIQGKLIQRGSAMITRDGKTLDGRKLSSAELDAAAAVSQEMAEKSKRYKRGACEGVVECYREHDYAGGIQGKLSVTIGPDGKAGPVKVKARGAPRKVRRCLQELGKSRRIDKFDGPEGDLICTWSGRLSGGTVMISRGTEYRPKKSARPSKKDTLPDLPDAK